MNSRTFIIRNLGIFGRQCNSSRSAIAFSHSILRDTFKMILLLLPAVVFVVLVTLILYARWNYGSLEALNIPVVKPHFLLGSTWDAHRIKNGLRDIEWMKKYGPVYGVYEGREAQVHVNDIEMLRHIMVKDYDHFSARRHIEFGDPILNEMPDFLPGEKWKIVRQLFSPQLTSGKVKNMSPGMNDAVKDYISDVKQKISKTKDGILENYDLRSGLFEMTTDLILRCVFNIKVSMNSDTGNHFVSILKNLLSGGEGLKPSPLLPWTLAFPVLKKFIGMGVDAKASHDFTRTFKQLMQDRKRNGTKVGDFTDYIMELLEKVETPEFKKADVTELTLMCQALVFFFAGQDQVTNLSLFLVHFVTQHPDAEKKIVQELDRVLAKNKGVIDHDCLSELTYLTACINETLRLYPLFFRPERVCTKDWEYEGYKIKKGMTVIMPIWAANRNPKYFDDPDEFDPERFMPYNKDKLHPYAMTSFGHGPRNCIGTRFAYEALLLTNAYLYKHLQFNAVEGSKIQFDGGNLFFDTARPIYFNTSVRN